MSWKTKYRSFCYLIYCHVASLAETIAFLQ
jgi:hypothetical protein